MPLRLDQVIALAHDPKGSTWFSREAGTAPDAEAAAAWKVFLIDVSHFVGMSNLMSFIARTWEPPPYFGHNWDALEDVISDENWNAGQNLLFAVHGAAAVAGDPARRPLLGMLVEVLEAALADRVSHGGAGACATVLLGVDEQLASPLQQCFPDLELRSAEEDSAPG